MIRFVIQLTGKDKTNDYFKNYSSNSWRIQSCKHMSNIWDEMSLSLLLDWVKLITEINGLTYVFSWEIRQKKNWGGGIFILNIIFVLHCFMAEFSEQSFFIFQCFALIIWLIKQKSKENSCVIICILLEKNNYSHCGSPEINKCALLAFLLHILHKY